MRRVALTVLAAALAAGPATAGPASWTLTRAQWGGADSAARVVAIAPVRSAVKALDAHSNARLAVVHNGGEEGIFWASRLERWLVALGIPSARLVDRTGAVPAGHLRLELLDAHVAPGP